MAERRMFTKKITDDDHFQNLSSSAQALYFHLSMAADDDGFCNQVNSSMFKAHASVQDLEALLTARYLYQFDSGVIVIKHWRMANALRKDRYTPTEFQRELSQLRVKPNGVYTEITESGCQMVANTATAGCQMVASGKDRLGKDSIDKIYRSTAGMNPGSESPEKPKKAEGNPAYKEIVDYLNIVCGTGYRASSNATQRLISARLHEGFTVEDFKSVIRTKHSEWANDAKMSKFLRPETLFGTKFESYLNQCAESRETSILDDVF